jgi:hypothetical protein
MIYSRSAKSLFVMATLIDLTGRDDDDEKKI